MKHSRLTPLVIASLTGLLSGCPNSNTNKPDDPTKPDAKSVGHKAVPEVTAANAGAAKCSFQNVQQIGALAKDGGIAIGFGDQGGLAAWFSPDGPRVKPLSSLGVAQGSASPIQFPKGTQPVAVIAVARGFAVIAKRIETTPVACEASCGDKPCPPEAKPGDTKPADAKPADAKPAAGKPADAKPAAGKPAETKPATGKTADAKPATGKPADAKPTAGKPAETKPAETKPAETKPAEEKPTEVKPAEAAPQTCEKPIGHEFFTQLTDLDGRNPSAGRPFHTGLVEIDTILPGDGRAAGLLTKNEVVWLQKRPDGRLDAERVELPTDESVIPVFGSGPPAILLVDKGGSLRLLDERGFHEIEGKFVGIGGKPAAAAPAKPGAPAAKPQAATPPPKATGEMTFRAHWDARGRIAVVRRLGDSTQFALVEKLVVHMLTDAESQEIRESFAKALDLRLENGRLRRTGWDKQALGGDIEAREADAAADVTQMHFAWTGSAFVFAHRSNPPHRTDAPSVGIVAAVCGADKP